MKTRLFTLPLLSGLLAILVFSLTGSVTAQKNLQLEKPEMEESADLTLVSISPASFANGVNMPVTIVGSNLDAVISATLGTMPLRNLQVVSSTQVTALVPWSIVTGMYTLTVQSQAGLDVVLPGAVTVTAGSTDWTSSGPYGGGLNDLVIDPVDSSRLFVSANRSGLWRTENGGASWSYAITFPFLGRTQISYLTQGQPPVIYSPCCLRSLDYGQTWEKKAPTEYDTLGSSGGGYGYYFTRPDQPTWVYLGVDPRNAIEPLGGLYTSADRGDTWSVMTNTSGLHVTALAFDPDNYDHLILGTRSGQVYTSTNGGIMWSAPITLPDPIGRLMYAPTLYNGQRSLWAFTWNYQVQGSDKVYTSTDGGQTWTPIQVAPGAPNNGITFHDSIPGLMWASAGNGYYSEDGGTTWNAVGLNGAHDFAVVPGATSRQTTTLFAAAGGGLYKSVNGGDTWEESDTGLGANLARTIAISPFNADEAYAATQPKGMLHTFDGGRHWQSLPIPIGDYDAPIAADPFTDGKVYFGNVDSGTPPAVRISSDHGLTFTEHVLTLPPPYSGWNADVAAIAPDPTIKDRILAGVCMGSNPPRPGFIYASTDGGLLWITQTTPINITCISRLTFDPNNPNVVYAGSSGSGLLRSTDRGATWTLLTNQPTTARFMSVEIDPSDSNSIYLCTFDPNGVDTGIYATHDGGVIWVKMTGVEYPVWALKFVKVRTDYWLYAATMNSLRYLRTIPSDPTTGWERASGIAGVAPADGFNATTEEGRAVYYVGTSGGTIPTASNASRVPVATVGSQNMAGGIYRAMLTNSQYESLYGTPGWQLRNRSGFGNRNNRIFALEVFNGQLYAATSNWADGGARVWRLTPENNWTPVSEVGMSSIYSQTNLGLTDLVTFNGQLYASLGWGANEGQIWRTSNGADWTKVTANELGGATNRTVTVMAVFSDTLYAAAGTPVEIWRSSTGDSGSWERVAQNGLGDPNNIYMSGAMTFNGALYVSLIHTMDGITIWRTVNGIDWTQVNTNGFGDIGNSDASGIATLGGYLYVGTQNNQTGGQIWRFDGTNWSRVVANGFGNISNTKIDSLYTVQNWLFAVIRNSTRGLQVWKTANGTDWTALNLNGLGSSNNVGTALWANSSAAFANSLFVATANDANGGEVWQYVVGFPVYLPLVMR